MVTTPGVPRSHAGRSEASVSCISAVLLWRTLEGSSYPRVGPVWYPAGRQDRISQSMRVLCIDEDRDLADLLSFTLTRAGLAPTVAHDFASALELLAKRPIDLVVMDASVAVGPGGDPIRKLKRQYPLTPLIVLSTSTGEDDKVSFFQRGADDFIAKPFSHRELVARIRARLRNLSAVRLDPEARVPVDLNHILSVGAGQPIAHQGKQLQLTAAEARLLQALVANPGAVVPKHLLAAHVSRRGSGPGTQGLRVVVHRLRRKLTDAGLDQNSIQTVAGVGVKYVQPTIEQASVEPNPEGD